MSPHHIEVTLLTTQLLYRFITGRRVPDWVFAIEAAFFIDELLERFRIYDVLWGDTGPRTRNRPDTHSSRAHNHEQRSSRRQYSSHSYSHGGSERRRSAAGDVRSYHFSGREDSRRGRPLARDFPMRDEGFDTEEYFRRRANSDRGRRERGQSRGATRRVHFEE